MQAITQACGIAGVGPEVQYPLKEDIEWIYFQNRDFEAPLEGDILGYNAPKTSIGHNLVLNRIRAYEYIYTGGANVTPTPNSCYYCADPGGGGRTILQRMPYGILSRVQK